MLYAFHLTAPKTETINGDVAVDTNRGWFGVPLVGVKIDKLSAVFGSHTLFARFPVPVRVANSWLFHANGKQCTPAPMLAQVHEQWPYTPPSSADTVEATIMPPYGRSDCAEPFSPARALNVVVPDFDRRNATFFGTAVIDVTVGADGKPLDARLAESSKTPAFDDAAREAAMKSTYTAAVAYCLPTIASYVFKATLSP